MKKEVLCLFLGMILFGFVGFVFAVEIKPIQSISLNSGNGICEYYEKQFSIGEQNTITLNDATIDIKYLGNKIWKINNYEGKLQNDDFFMNNDNSKLNGVRFNFDSMDQYNPDGNMGFSEQDYYPWDCQGYSSSKGLVSEVKIKEGWNLVPYGIVIRDCSYNLKDALCNNDILVSYTYIPSLNNYFTPEQIKTKQYDSKIREYFSEENEFVVQKSSKWIYVKQGSGNKRMIGNFGAHIPYRNEYLNNSAFKLKRGWNFLYVDAFMVYDDNWNINPLSIDDLKGNCIMEKIHSYETSVQSWSPNLANGHFINEKLTKESIGLGIVIKVSSDCSLGSSSNSVTNPPQLPIDNPTNNNPSNSISLNDFPTQIGDYVLKSSRLADKSECGSVNSTNVCVQMSRLEYVNSNNRSVHVLPTKITSGKEGYIAYIKSRSSEKNVGGISGVYRGAEPWELYWFTNNGPDMIGTQDYNYLPQSDGGYNTATLNGTTDTDVAKWLLQKYPPI